MAVAGAAKRYGQAAFDVARENNLIDEWDRDMASLGEVLSDPEMMEYFQSPAVRHSAKVAALEEMLPAEHQTLLRNLLLLLMERRRFHAVPEVAAVFREMVLESRGIAVARVTTAVELSEDERSLVRDRLSTVLGKDIELIPQVDPSIIGGIVAQVGDDLLDGSVRSQLTLLRRQMVN